MEIQPLAGQSAGATAVGGAPATTALTGTLTYIAQQLGMSPGEVRDGLRDGASINDLATQQGMSPAKLHTAVAAHINGTRQAQGRNEIPTAELDRTLSQAFAHRRRVPATTAATASIAGYAASTAIAAADRQGDDGPPPAGRISILA
jgi:transposase-like protein